MHKIEINGYKTVQFASCIEELSEDEFLHMIKLYLMQQAGEIDIPYFRFMLTMKLLNIKKTAKYYNMPAEKRELVHDNINRLVETLDSFYEYAEEDGTLVKRLNLNWIRQMVPVIGRLVGPDDALTNCTIFEYKEAFNYYNDYLNTKSEISVCKLIAVLYRPRKMFYRIRNRFSGTNIEEREAFTVKTNPIRFLRRADKIHKLPDHIKTSVLLWFGNCVEYIVSGKPVIDGIEIDLSVLFKKSSNDNGPQGIGLTGIIYSLAESNVFGSVDQTSNTHLYDILVRLYQLKTDHDAMIAKSKRTND